MSTSSEDRARQEHPHKPRYALAPPDLCCWANISVVSSRQKPDIKVRSTMSCTQHPTRTTWTEYRRAHQSDKTTQKNQQDQKGGQSLEGLTPSTCLKEKVHKPLLCRIKFEVPVYVLNKLCSCTKRKRQRTTRCLRQTT